MKKTHCTDSRNTVVATLGLWAFAVAEATRADVFGRLPDEVNAALVIFAVVFAIMTVTLDRDLRTWLEGRGTASSWYVVLAMDAVAVAVALAFAADSPGGSLVLAHWAPVLLFAMPVTIALSIGTARAAWSGSDGALRSPASKEPARRPAAT